jgi:hypothetical protein
MPQKSKLIDKLFRAPIKDKGLNEPHYFTPPPNFTHQADLLFLPNDDGYKFALVVIDIGSRKTDSEPLKDKNASPIIQAFKNIYKRNIIKLPNRIEVDNGTEFKGDVKKYFKDLNIYLRVAKTARHRQQGLVERKNQSIGTILLKRMTEQEILTGEQSNHWVEDLPKAIKDLNKKSKPPKPLPDNPVCEKDACKLIPLESKVRIILEQPRNFISNKKEVGRFRSGDVRWSIKPSIITNIIIKPGFPPLYTVDNTTSPQYTKNQLQIITKNEILPDKSVLRGKPKIEKILDNKKDKGRLYLLIKYLGNPDPEWIFRSVIIKDQSKMVLDYEKAKKG